MSNSPTNPTGINNIPINYNNPGPLVQNNPYGGYYTQSPYAHLLSNTTQPNSTAPYTNPNPQFYNVSNPGPQMNYPMNPPQQQFVGYGIPGNFQTSSPIQNQIGNISRSIITIYLQLFY